MLKLLTAFLLLLFSFINCEAQNGERIWNEFKTQLRDGELSVDQIKPREELGDSFKPILLSFMDSLRVQASDKDWDVTPEIIEKDEAYLFLFPWSSRQSTANYCLTVVTEDDKWFLQHLESIYLRLDRLGPLPVDEFPDLDESTKAWVREETYWSYVIINFYIPLSRDHGRQYALNRLKDGGGYFVAAQTWVPFLEAHKAFILYLCWEQSNLRGNYVRLVRLNDREAKVEMQSQYLALYGVSGHMRNILDYREYKEIFETIWQDRAGKAGWDLDIKYGDDYMVSLKFTRDPEKK